ncbi:hypothetical protein F5J12DRAFT_819224 [Pisolithus orientalis]|uniref:uncharacterized protein n=1 Tax=Pisolithus orientalis TaxID=936130 RepID=UPI002225AE08|nr:uncharacterized protein F5J12DRAFT_819224 [Pisolithus orientalis]KAI6012619.1 hypothetical protein F5J12DRAFT_819224 [Pisolithus orientalis]
MSRRRRPTAFEAASLGESTGTSDVDRKRVRDSDPETRRAKRRNLDGTPRPPRKYEPRPYEKQEAAGLRLLGEEQYLINPDDRHIRMLSRFAFFDPNHELEIDELEVEVEGAGFAAAKFEVEDEGQEDDLDGDVDELQYIRLTTVRRFVINYLYEDRPVYVETDHAIYELFEPSKKYRREYRSFYKPRRVMQLIISSAFEDPDREFAEFVQHFTSLEVLDQPLVERDLWDVVPKLKQVLETIYYGDRVRESHTVSYLLSRDAPKFLKMVDVTKLRRRSPPIPDIEYKGNLDLATLRPENQVPTHVTPRISQLALGLFRERLRVVGPQPVAEPEPPYADLTKRVKGFIIRVSMRRQLEFSRQQRLKPRSRYLKYLTIDRLDYNVGDTIVSVVGEDTDRRSIPPELPHPDDVSPTDILADYFWFARIVWLDYEDELTCMAQLGHPQELFLTKRCDSINMSFIIGKVQAHYIAPGQTLAEVSPHDFFYRYANSMNGTTTLEQFKSANMEKITAAQENHPPDCCHVCDIKNKLDQDRLALPIENGVAWHAREYHIDDFVLIRADDGPCLIGHIRGILLEPDSDNEDDNKIVVTLLGRVDKVHCRPETVLKDERHLFYTDERVRIVISDLVGICFVVVSSSLPEIEDWKAVSPLHFYIKYRHPVLDVRSWDKMEEMLPQELEVCQRCLDPNLENLRDLDDYFKKGPRRNASAEVKVYNQCSNRLLRQAILLHGGKDPDPLRAINGDALPDPPMPGDIDCIRNGVSLVGFQPHSQMNMFQKADDRKSNLILNILSWVDFLRPRYCIFENVRGFLTYNLKARQDGPHRLKGGIPMGGFKLLIRALIDMDYQVRFSLLQAGHYGTPQTRTRFFLIAADRKHELPELPQPTHDFPLPSGRSIEPVRTVPGIAPHRFVSTRDAISDLPVFHWKNPKRNYTREQMRGLKHIRCDESKPWCGLSGPDVAYEHEPRTTFQLWCRKMATTDLQHYTRTYEPIKVERVVTIPFGDDADYRTLRPDLWEWQFNNPLSATARDGFRPGYYGRVPKDGWFQTTVTNVDPTAKQCRVLHPYCRRIVTVRELARSQGFPDCFVFYAVDDRVVTMHRQIGNAVPWPLSMAIAREFRTVLLKKWKEGMAEDVMEID